MGGNSPSTQFRERSTRAEEGGGHDRVEHTAGNLRSHVSAHRYALYALPPMPVAVEATKHCSNYEQDL